MRNLTAFVLALGLLSGCATLSGAAPGDSRDANKQLAVAFTEEVYNQRLLERIPDYVAEDFVDHSLGAPEDARGPAWVRRQVEAGLESFPDLRFTIRHVVADGDLVLVHWRATGTEAQAQGEAGQPRVVRLDGHSLFRVRQGRLVEAWGISDRLEALLQRGYKLLPP